MVFFCWALYGGCYRVVVMLYMWATTAVAALVPGLITVGLSCSYINELCRRFHIPDPSSLIWVHAVDSRAELEDAPADAMFYESDAGALSDDGRVVMCHYPTQTTSDLYLDELLSEVEERGVGLKIDIKLEELVGPVGDLLSRDEVDVPVWWNADVFGDRKLPLRALAEVADENTVLSLGYIGVRFGEIERKDIITQLTESVTNTTVLVLW